MQATSSTSLSLSGSVLEAQPHGIQWLTLIPLILATWECEKDTNTVSDQGK
jgi:hypothetical protein